MQTVDMLNAGIEGFLSFAMDLMIQPKFTEHLLNVSCCVKYGYADDIRFILAGRLKEKRGFIAFQNILGASS